MLLAPNSQFPPIFTVLVKVEFPVPSIENLCTPAVVAANLLVNATLVGKLVEPWSVKFGTKIPPVSTIVSKPAKVPSYFI